MTVSRFPIRDRMAWLAWRARDLTASDIGAAVGLDPYKSALKLYAEKTGLLMPDGDNPSMRRGRWLEAAVLEAIRDQQPDWEVRPAKVYLRDEALRLGATPDAVAATDEPGLTNIQCKVVARPTYEREWALGPPMHYQLQTLTEGMLLDAARSYLAALVIDTYTAELYLHPVPRHEAAEAKVRTLAAEFWANVAAGKRPAADYKQDAETLAAMFPQSVAEPVLNLAGDNRLGELLPLRETLKSELADIEKGIEAIDTEIKDTLGEAERAELPGWKISWKTQKRKAYTVAETTTRPLRVTRIEEKEKAA
ncbi:YqaJ viral recombinase family protein [Mesorhizobium sp. M0293]|uniref:YqaJ viral recombinase family nuclease n=1 Tax=Mesorhizobium sp. M0293 TaxID=2956930 RepID=UPI00333CDAAA